MLVAVLKSTFILLFIIIFGTLSFPILCRIVSYELKTDSRRCSGHRRRKGSMVGEHHGECGARAYNGGPYCVVSYRPPPEAESILVIGYPTEPANLAPVRENSMFCSVV